MYNIYIYIIFNIVYTQYIYIYTRILVYTHNIYWYIQCNTYYKIMIGSNYRNMFLFNSFGPSQRREEISNPIFPGFPNQNQGNTIIFNCICIQSLSNIHMKLPNIGLSQVYHRQFPHCRLLSLRVAARGGWRWVKYSVDIQHSYGKGFMFRSFDDLPIKTWWFSSSFR